MGVELAPVKAMLDEIHPSLPTLRDQNSYALGKIAGHNIVIAVLPAIGTNSAATVAIQLLNDFPSVRFGLLVGIGGGVPDLENEIDIRLGDIVVSKPTQTAGGVVQYDMGKETLKGFERTGTLNKPSAVLRAAVQQLVAQHELEDSQVPLYLSQMLKKFPKMKEKYTYPDAEQDQLFGTAYDHQGGKTCAGCDSSQVIRRPLRSSLDPVIHYGTIGSANRVVKNAAEREKLKSGDLDIICVEMEAAGLMDSFPCLVIRGICDYADSHKNKKWQPYAAATAAAYMKELLSAIPAQEVSKMPDASGVVQIQPTQSADGDFEDNHKDIGKWLEPEPFLAQVRNSIDRVRHTDTCKWILTESEVTGWMDEEEGGNGKVLWIHGKPGCGKTILASTIIHNLLNHTQIGCHVSYAFCSKRTTQQSAVAVLRSLIWQVALRGDLSAQQKQQILRAYKEYSKPTREPQLNEGLDLSARSAEEKDEMIFYSLYTQILQAYKRIVIVIDGLDECNEPDRLLRHIVDVMDRMSVPVKILIVSQDISQISTTLKRQRTVTMLNMDAGESPIKIRGDIERFLSDRLRELELRQQATELQIRKTLLEKADGMFLWAALAIRAVEDSLVVYGEDVKSVVEEVNRLPTADDMGDFYLYLLTRIFMDRSSSSPQLQAKRLEIKIRIFQWALWSRRALLVPELFAAHELQGHLWPDEGKRAIELPPAGAERIEDFKSRTVRMCSPLITVQPDDSVGVVHSTLKDYLVEAQRSERIPLHIRTIADKKNFDTIAAMVCLQYIAKPNFADFIRFGKGNLLITEANDKFPFYGYGALFWHTHLTGGTFSLNVEKLLNEFLGRDEAITWLEAYWRQPSTTFGDLQVLQSKVNGACHITSPDFVKNLFEKAIKKRKIVLGTDHVDTLTSMANLASTYRNQGRWKEAEELEVQVMETRKRVLGAEHPDTLTSMNNLAFTWKMQGRRAEALNLMEECVQLRTRVLGVDHPHTLSSSTALIGW